jgi:hypothetical protein
MDRLGLDGRFEPPASDGLMVTTVNGLGNKIDAFVSKRLTYTGKVDDGRVDADLSVEITNAAPARGLPDYGIGSFSKPAPPTGTNTMSVFVYTGTPADRVQVDGKAVEVSTGRTADGWFVHQLVVTIPPGGTSTVSLHLAGELPPGPYSLRLEPGGGPSQDDVTVDIAADKKPVVSQRRLGETTLLTVAR